MARRTGIRPTEISLKDVFPHARFLQSGEATANSCARTARDMQRGGAYFAFDDDGTDPTGDAAIALHRGATAIVTERLLPLSNAPQCIVSDVRSAYARLCYALTRERSSELRKIAVAGTHGKTIAAWLIAAVLGQAKTGGFLCSLGRSDGSDFSPEGMPADFPRAAAEHFAACAKACAKTVVVEIPPAAIAHRDLDGCEFETVVIVNVSRDGVGPGVEPANYRAGIQRLREHLKAGGSLVLNIDDPFCREFSRESGMPVLTVGFNEAADVTAKLLERSASEQTFLLTAGPESVAVRTQFVGDPFMQHALAAAAVGLLQGLSLTDIARGLESVDKLPGRMERLECGQPFAVFVDAASRPDALSAALETVREIATGRVLCVCEASPNVERGHRERLGGVLEAQTDMTVIAAEKGCEEIVQEILTGCESQKQIVVTDDRAAAVRETLSQARAGDVVLLVGGRNAAFPGFTPELDDRETAEQFLREAYKPEKRAGATKKRG
ncbi:MAG: Mur ligase family protein [Pirellulales bacterium]